MDREIKFRAWDGKTMVMDVQRMYDSLGSWFNSKGEEIDIYKTGIPVDSFDSIVEEKDIILMQYIGEKDINGQGLYEDDVIIFSDCARLYRIIWQGCGFHAFLISGKGKMQLGEQGRVMRNIAHADCERVGNIYENPELMEVKP